VIMLLFLGRMKFFFFTFSGVMNIDLSVIQVIKSSFAIYFHHFSSISPDNSGLDRFVGVVHSIRGPNLYNVHYYDGDWEEHTLEDYISAQWWRLEKEKKKK